MKSICKRYKDDIWIEMLNLLEKQFTGEISYIIDNGVRDTINRSFWSKVWIEAGSR